MGTVSYSTKTNDSLVKRLLDDPTIGKELTRQLLTGDYETKNEEGEAVEPYVKIHVGNEVIKIGVKELTSK